MKSIQNRDLFSDEMLALESIEDVGPRGNYLTEEDTVEMYSDEIYFPRLFNVGGFKSWEAEGCPSVFEKAKAAVERRLASYQLPEYTPRQKKILENILKGIDD